LFDGEKISFDASLYIYMHIYIYIQGVPGGMDKTSGVFFMLKYADITQNTYMQS